MKLDPNNLDVDKHAEYSASLAYTELLSAHDLGYRASRGDYKEEVLQEDLEFLLSHAGPDYYEIKEYFELAKVIGADAALEYAHSVYKKAQIEAEILWEDNNNIGRCGGCDKHFEKDELSDDHPNLGLLCEDCVLEEEEYDEEEDN